MKDPQGHGSNPGGSYQNIDKNLRGAGKHVGYSNGAWRISKLGSGYLATHNRTGDSFRGDNLGHVSDQLAARALASSGPKSDAAPVHDAWASTPGGDRGDAGPVTDHSATGKSGPAVHDGGMAIRRAASLERLE